MARRVTGALERSMTEVKLSSLERAELLRAGLLPPYGTGSAAADSVPWGLKGAAGGLQQVPRSRNRIVNAVGG